MALRENTDIDVEKEDISPKDSPKIFTAKEALQHHLNYISEESENVPYGIPHKINIKYGSKTGQKLDIFGIDLPDNAPILVYLPSGYWKQTAKDISRYLTFPLYDAGIKTIIVGYDRRRRVTLWDIVDQVDSAIMYALRYAEEKGSRGLYLAGHCSGAHLIAQVLKDFELFQSHVIKPLSGVFLISGIYDLRDFRDTSEANEVHLHAEDATSLSPLFANYTHLEATTIRFYVFAAQEDCPVLKKQSKDFYELLQTICDTNNLYFEIKDSMNHFDMVECFSSEDNYLKRIILNDICKHS